MAGSRSTERRGPLAGLDREERLALLGAASVIASMLLLPWYVPEMGVQVDSTGLSDPGFAQLALIVTVCAAVVLVWRVRRGYAIPRPLREGTLLALAGAWSALIVVYLMFDRPGPDPMRLRYGIFVALAGTAAITVAGLRRRRAELEREDAEKARFAFPGAGTAARRRKHE